MCVSKIMAQKANKNTYHEKQISCCHNQHEALAVANSSAVGRGAFFDVGGGRRCGDVSGGRFCGDVGGWRRCGDVCVGHCCSDVDYDRCYGNIGGGKHCSDVGGRYGVLIKGCSGVQCEGCCGVWGRW